MNHQIPQILLSHTHPVVQCVVCGTKLVIHEVQRAKGNDLTTVTLVVVAPCPICVGTARKDGAQAVEQRLEDSARARDERDS